jgi:tryptophan-rich sensory protein
MENQTQYKEPSWAPPSGVFAPIWTVLYVGITISFGYVGYFLLAGAIPFSVALPFLLNLFFNVIFTPLQFRLQSFALATIDILLVLVTLIWAIIVIHPYAPWISFVNIPYLAWVCFATGLQITVAFLNRE